MHVYTVHSRTDKLVGRYLKKIIITLKNQGCTGVEGSVSGSFKINFGDFQEFLLIMKRCLINQTCYFVSLDVCVFSLLFFVYNDPH